VKILKIAKKLVVWVIKHRIFTGFRTIGTFQKSLQKTLSSKKRRKYRYAVFLFLLVIGKLVALHFFCDKHFSTSSLDLKLA